MAAAPVITVLCPPDGERPAGMAALDGRAEVRYVDAAGLPDALPGTEVLFLWDFFSGAVRDAWPHAADLRWIHVAAAGVDTLLFPELVASQVVVTNARGIFDRPIAEYVLGAVLAFAKDSQTSFRHQQERLWRHRETRRLDGATALVIGTGAIGREIARLLRAVGMDVRGAGRRARDSDPDFGTVVAAGELAAHVGWADHVVLAAPLTDDTRGLVDAQLLAAMRPGSHLVNIARGPIVDEGALVDAVRAGTIAGATLDVFSVEPLAADSPLWTLPGVVVTPHMSGDVVGWRDALAQQFLAQADRWLAGERLTNVVDKEKGYVA